LVGASHAGIHLNETTSCTPEKFSLFGEKKESDKKGGGWEDNPYFSLGRAVFHDE